MSKKKFSGACRKPVAKDFVGKTIKSFRKHADNHWRVTFTDGSAIAINAENAYLGMGMSLPILEVIDQ
jgi:hypothetical protein